jgi:UDP-N-acetylmuramate dehydrogenase
MKNSPATLRDDLRCLREPGRLEFFERVDLRAWSPYRLGGPAEMVVRCLDAEAVSDTIKRIHDRGSRWIVIGGSGALVLSDGAIDVPLVKLAGPLATWQKTRDGFFVGAGATLAQASRAAARAGLSGFERLFGVPGTVGGAVVSALRLHGHGALGGIHRVAAVVPTGGLVILTLEDATPQLAEGSLVALGFWFDAAPEALRLVGEEPATVERGGVIRALFHHGGGAMEAVLRDAGVVDVVVGGARQHPERPNDVALTSMATADDVFRLAETVADQVHRALGRRPRHRLCSVDRGGRTRYESLRE